MYLDTPISIRVSRAVIAVVGSGIAFSIALFLISDFRQAMKAESLRYQSAAYAFASATSEGMSNGNPRRVLEVIRGVRELPDVIFVAAKDKNGAAVAELGAGARLLEAGSGLRSLFSTSILVSAPIRKAGAVIGSVELQAEVKDIRTRYLTAFAYSLVFGALIVLGTAMLARYQVSRIVRPLGALAEELADIGRRSDLARRLAKVRNDEVGILVDAFNEMIGQIAERDRLLRKHRDTLEQTVEERTAELQLAKNEAVAANASKSAFLATMSHEIRTPMNGIIVMAEMLAAAPLSPRHRRFAEIITRSGKNLVHIINDILDLSKIEAGRVDLENIEFSLDGVIEDVALLFAERAREKNLSLSVFISQETPSKVMGDPVRLSQVVGNLVNNALKFTSEGGVAVWVEADSKAVSITVEDSGIGLSAEQINNIFARFSQADASITRKFGGTGLGLTISKELIELMGGNIHVESEVGAGSRFVLTLPMTATLKQDPVKTTHPITVRLIDDNRLSRSATMRGLTERGLLVVDHGEKKCDAVLVSDKYFTSARIGDTSAPIFLLRSSGTDAFPPSDQHTPVAELSLPLTRDLLDKLCKALETRDPSKLTLQQTKNPTLELPDLCHLKVLVVDDLAVNREVLSEALRTFNVRADLADSGPTAIAKVTRQSYDVVFMDCSMPDMDGFEATREIRSIETRSHQKKAFIVALTGHAAGKDSKEWQEAGMNNHITKPFTISQLATVLQDTEQRRGASSDSKPGDDRTGRVEQHALLSSQTLEMFQNIFVATGSDLRKTVFAMFCGDAHPAFERAKAEIEAHGTESSKLIHALKSHCSSAGALRATQMCHQIEARLLDGQTLEPGALDALKIILDQTVKAMQEFDATHERADFDLVSHQ